MKKEKIDLLIKLYENQNLKFKILLECILEIKNELINRKQDKLIPISNKQTLILQNVSENEKKIKSISNEMFDDLQWNGERKIKKLLIILPENNKLKKIVEVTEYLTKEIKKQNTSVALLLKEITNFNEKILNYFMKILQDNLEKNSAYFFDGAF